ncbi:phosphatidate cytidylyltransferase [Amylibacter sp.]|nr:phosphatidate cytidylyltransferase [Amylibacter sp.]
MNAKLKNSDLLLRVISSIVMIFLGAFFLGIGGTIFKIILILISAILAWEIFSFNHLHKHKRILTAIFFALIFATYILFSQILSLILLIIFLIFYKIIIKHNDYAQRSIYLIMIFFSLITLSDLRLEVGLVQTLWVICCVIASDVGGYFVGRTVGGPKLWPIISPKKTWSGIIGGWLLTIIITYIFIILFKEIEFYLLFFSIFISFFSQFGDLYESFLKRNAGIKDSSNLIPGHGGFLDRFDGMIGAFFAVFIINFININNWIF